MDTHLEEAITHRPGIPRIAQRNVPQARVDPCRRAPVVQATNPALERGALDDFDHLPSVNHGSQPLKCIVRL